MSQNNVRYELFEHTADIGLRAFGNDYPGLFINAAQGMFSIITGGPEKRSPALRRTGTTFEIAVSAANAEELLVGWLSELLALADIHGVVFSRFNFLQLTDTACSARVTAFPMSKPALRANEIKAVTYHRLSITRLDDGRLKAEVIFDI
ncbi:MAG: archease [Candidatus Omnitrophica bacterium]|jgi:Uncharacterized conserved protein|nr:archease [Candidatus Omnitrophota bacterium]